MTGSTDPAGAPIAETILSGYDEYSAQFRRVVLRARSHFEQRAWDQLQQDSAKLIDLYGEAVGATLERIGEAASPDGAERALWGSARRRYAERLADRADAEIAATFFNSITRRVFTTMGIDPEIEFDTIVRPTVAPAPIRRIRGGAEGVVRDALEGSGLPGLWRNLSRDSVLAARELMAAFRDRGHTDPISEAAILDTVFYRGQGAYVVGTVHAGAASLPVAFCVHHTARGLVLGSVLTEETDINVLFSYTRAAFHVDVSTPTAAVDYLSQLMPRKRRAELYSTIGHRKHAKTELYADLMTHVANSSDRFEHARGIKGMVMIVFTLPGFDVVFKVIRDRFPFPKQTTTRQIKAKYRLVFRHDRAGRLIDAQEFEHLQFDRDRFTPELLEELAADATRAVTIDETSVTLHHVYIERRVIPLDIYVREANPVKARAAIVDYGRAIKNLAATNIFPGDMLLKNFGITRSGRVVFYDYDEITELTRCKFREMPQTDNPTDEMSATPWFGVGDDDVFPEEFTRFLGLREELREVFDYHHSDLFGVRFWQRAQDRVRRGETIEIFPYERTRRLGATHRQVG